MKQSGMFLLACASVAMAGAAIPENRAKQIRAAIPEKPQVAPKKVRRVLIWNTPAHLE
ncbi:hypothetical protein HQ560_05995, partial [bacterium]|nr:hypothetical protein [bacterium]